MARLIKSVETICDISKNFGHKNQAAQTFLKVFDVAAGESDANFVHFSSRNWGTCSIIFFFCFGDVTHFELSQKVTKKVMWIKTKIKVQG